MTHGWVVGGAGRPGDAVVGVTNVGAGAELVGGVVVVGAGSCGRKNATHGGVPGPVAGAADGVVG